MNYKCWKKGGHSLDKGCELINPPDSMRTYSTFWGQDSGSCNAQCKAAHQKSMLGTTPPQIGWAPIDATTRYTDKTKDVMAPYLGGYMTINLGGERDVAGVATQGRGNTD